MRHKDSPHFEKRQPCAGFRKESQARKRVRVGAFSRCVSRDIQNQPNAKKNPAMVLSNLVNQHKKQRSLRYLDSFHRYTHRIPPGCELRYSEPIQQNFALAMDAAGKGLRVGTSEKIAVEQVG